MLTPNTHILLAAVAAESPFDRLLWIIISGAVGAILTGGAMLIGFYAIHQRFLNKEFPAVIDSLRSDEKELREAMVQLGADVGGRLDKLTEVLANLDRALIRLSAAGDFRDKRIDALERSQEAQREIKRRP